MYCSKCGAQNQQGARFCVSCGQDFQQASDQGQAGQNENHSYQRYSAQQGTRSSAEDDAQQNKAMGIIAYFLFFIPLLAAKDSQFARYHANQGLILFICCVAIGIVNAIFTTLIISTLSFGMLGIWRIINIIFVVAYIGLGILGIFGIINAAQGRMKPMPVIGSMFGIIR